jgi:hypothetical protein
LARKFRCIIRDMKLRALFLFALALFLAPTLASAQVPTCSMQAIPSSIDKGGSFTLRWSSTNATAANIPGPGLGTVSPNGSRNLIPVSSTRFIGTFTGPNGKATCTATVFVRVNGVNSAVVDGVYEPLAPTDPLNPPDKLDSTPTVTPTAPTLPPDNTRLSGRESTGLVPCTGTNCQACHLAQLGQNIINFLIGLSIPLAAALFAWAGILMFSSPIAGEASTSRINKGKDIFKSVFIGFMIVIAAWLVVQTILKTVLKDGYYQSWNEIKCVDADDRPLNAKFSDLLSVLPWLNTAPQVTVVGNTGFEASYGCGAGQTALNGRCVATENPSIDFGPVSTLANPTTCYSGDTLEGKFCSGAEGYYSPFAVTNLNSGPGGNCPPGYKYTEDEYSYWCQGPGGAEDWEEVIDRPVGAVTKGVQQWNEQLYAACERAGLSDCAVAQAIMTHESRGNPGAYSPAGAAGLMQLLPTTACGMDSTIDGCETCKVRADNTNGNCAGVAQTLLTNTDLNMSLGATELNRLYQKYNGDVSLVAAAYNGGDKANQFSNACGVGTAWQCTLNPGYTETRKYVPNVVGTYSKLKI